MFNGWKLYEKKSGAGSYDKYNNQMVVIISKAKKNKFLYLPNKVFLAIGSPKRVRVMTRGSNVALCAGSASDGYSLQNRNGSMPCLQIAIFIRENNLQSGVYDVHIENGMAVFDSADTPSQV